MKTRKVRRKDGRVEIVRLLDRGDVTAYSPEDPLSGEASIVWKEDIDQLAYVRVLIVPKCESSRKPIKLSGGGRIIGYATLLPDVPKDSQTGKYTRRVFYLKEADIRADAANDEVLTNAVDPRSVLPGSRGAPVTAARREEPPQPRHSDSRDFIVTLRGSSVILDWIGDARELISARDDYTGQDAVDTMVEDGPVYGELISRDGGPTLPLRKKAMEVGRIDECDIVLRFKTVSAVHCRLSVESGYWYVCDLNSTNGVKVDGTRVPLGMAKRLDPGAVFAIASHEFAISYEPSELGAAGTPPPDEFSI